MAKTTLGKGAVKAIHDVLDKLFDRLKARVLGNTWTDKRVSIGVIPELTLSGLFRQASAEERNRPDPDLEQSLLRTADGYLEAQRVAMKTRTVHAVESFLREAEHKGVDTDVETVLGGELGTITRNVTDGVKKIIDTEATHVRNTGTLDGLLKVNSAVGIEDPTVFFIVVRDDDLCEECRRLHLLDDGVTPRVWKLSQIGHGYHKRGDEEPKLGGLHPHCRCSLGTVLPGYGFSDSGMIHYIGPKHDEFESQQGGVKLERMEKGDVFYHGTPHNFDQFQPKPGHNTATMGLAAGADSVQRHGFFFTQNKNFANSFAGPTGRTVNARLNLGNQLDLSGPYHTQVKHFEALAPHFQAQGLSPEHGYHHLPGSGKHKRLWQIFDGDEGRKAVEAMKSAGYNSVKFGEEDDDGQPVTTHVVFHPSQIKTL